MIRLQAHVSEGIGVYVSCVFVIYAEGHVYTALYS